MILGILAIRYLGGRRYLIKIDYILFSVIFFVSTVR